MTLLKALAYFTREATLNLVRSWRVSLLAICTIALSLFLAGLFLLLSGNLRQLIDQWRDDSRVVVYLRSGLPPAELERLEGLLGSAPWSLEVQPVSPEVARERFRHAFPSLADLLDGWGDDPLPASLEVRLRWDGVDPAALQSWMGGLRQDPAVTMVDDDRDWLAQLETAVVFLEALALAIGAILLVTAVFTISSIIRLTAYLYHDEIAVMRLVGATEFFIRGPFYVEGMLQGLGGGLLAVVLLISGHQLATTDHDGGLLTSLLLSRFLTAGQLALLVGLGALAGLIGAIASLRRESLGRTAELPDWETPTD